MSSPFNYPFPPRGTSKSSLVYFVLLSRKRRILVSVSKIARHPVLLAGVDALLIHDRIGRRAVKRPLLLPSMGAYGAEDEDKSEGSKHIDLAHDILQLFRRFRPPVIETRGATCLFLERVKKIAPICLSAGSRPKSVRSCPSLLKPPPGQQIKRANDIAPRRSALATLPERRGCLGGSRRQGRVCNGPQTRAASGTVPPGFTARRNFFFQLGINDDLSLSSWS
jgi:hypothetical protein